MFSDLFFYHPWKWFQPIIGQITVMIFHEIATVSWFQTKSQTVWFLSWKSTTKIRFASACNHCIASQKTKRGENKAHMYSLQNSRQNWSFEGAASPKRGKLVRTYAHWTALTFSIFEEICLTWSQMNNFPCLKWSWRMRYSFQTRGSNKWRKKNYCKILKSRRIKTLREVRRHLLTPGRVAIGAKIPKRQEKLKIYQRKCSNTSTAK